jgi:hypothetical protein
MYASPENSLWANKVLQIEVIHLRERYQHSFTWLLNQSRIIMSVRKTWSIQNRTRTSLGTVVKDKS